MKRKSEKQFARETAKHVSMVKQSRRKVSLQVEKALFAAASILRVHGQLIIQPREAAISKVMEISHGEEEQLTFFTNGAVHLPPRENKQNTTLHRVPNHQAQCLSRGPRPRQNRVKLAAAVAYKATDYNEWIVKSFSVPPGGRYYLEAEMAGIAGALPIAISRIVDLRKTKASITSHKVVIFIDSQDAIHQLQKLQEHTRKLIHDHTPACKLITRSQYLHRLGVPLEVHWIPSRHPGIPGNLLADAEARQTAKSNLMSPRRNLSRPVYSFTMRSGTNTETIHIKY
jgi:ribonuclease HI